MKLIRNIIKSIKKILMKATNVNKLNSNFKNWINNQNIHIICMHVNIAFNLNRNNQRFRKFGEAIKLVKKVQEICIQSIIVENNLMNNAIAYTVHLIC